MRNGTRRPALLALALATSGVGVLGLLLRLGQLLADSAVRRSVGVVTLGALLLLTVSAVAGFVISFRQQRRQRHQRRLSSRYQAMFEQSQDSVIVAHSATGRIIGQS